MKTVHVLVELIDGKSLHVNAYATREKAAEVFKSCVRENDESADAEKALATKEHEVDGYKIELFEEEVQK